MTDLETITFEPQDFSTDQLADILESTVKHDRENKIITFLCLLLTYTDTDQVNIGYNAASSTGKSYIPLELAAYFPAEDLIILGYASPTAFFHELGEWDEEQKIRVIDLSKKIIVFLDQPSDQLLQRLRPLLSHDRKKLRVKITDRRRAGGLGTKSVELVGFPSVVFCSTRFSLDEQERTRLFLLSPETSHEKIEAAINLLAKKLADPRKYRAELDEDLKRRWLRNKVNEIKDAGIEQIIITDTNMEYLRMMFLAAHKNLLPRFTRDFPRLVALAKGHALLNIANRQITDHNLIAKSADVENALNIYNQVSAANELGLPPAVYEIYEKVLKPRINAGVGITRAEFAKFYFEEYYQPLGYKRINETLTLLEAVGLIHEEPDPDDKRRKLIYLIDIEAKDEEKPAQEEAYCDRCGVGPLNPLTGYFADKEHSYCRECWDKR